MAGAAAPRPARRRAAARAMAVAAFMMGEAEAAAAARRGIRFLKITTRVVLPRECEKGPKKEGRKEGDCVSRRRRCTGGGGEGASTNEVGASTGTIDMSKTRRRMRPELLPIRLCAYFDYRSSNSCPYGAASCGSEKSSVGRKLVTTTKAHEPKVYRPGYQMANLVFILAHSKIISPVYLPSLLPIACWLLCMLLCKWYTSIVARI